MLGTRTAYCGRGDVKHVLNTGVGTILEIELGHGWFSTGDDRETVLSRHGGFMPDMQGTRHALKQIDYTFKVVVADILTLPEERQERLELLEMELRHLVLDEQGAFREEIQALVERDMLPALDELFQEFESVALWVPSDDVDLYLAYVQKHLHPFLVCSPFIQRVFEKPLGYSGDYRMLNQLLEAPFLGGALFAKTLNACIIGTSAGEAYRFRVDPLTETLTKELRDREGAPTAILSVGCGAAREVQNLIRQGALNLESARFTLMDFNSLTLEHCEEHLNELCEKHQSSLDVRYLHLNVQQLLDDSLGQNGEWGLSPGSLDVIYCAGLFDYLSEEVCVPLISLYSDLLAPGGSIV
ncbi:MAG: class I SAM-dependent methyltransferase, partial [Verrucomicrobiales bacterium]